jgi:hypothetical protein
MPGEEDRIRHYTLPELLPEGMVIAIHLDLGTLTSMVIEKGMPKKIAESMITVTELRVILPLFESFPYYCPHEVLYAAFSSGKVTEKSVTAARLYLQEAQENDLWNQEIRSVRNAISRVRFKLHPLGLDIGALLSRGYILTAEEK